MDSDILAYESACCPDDSVQAVLPVAASETDPGEVIRLLFSFIIAISSLVLSQDKQALFQVGINLLYSGLTFSGPSDFSFQESQIEPELKIKRIILEPETGLLERMNPHKGCCIGSDRFFQIRIFVAFPAKFSNRLSVAICHTIGITPRTEKSIDFLCQVYPSKGTSGSASLAVPVFSKTPAATLATMSPACRTRSSFQSWR